MPAELQVLIRHIRRVAGRQELAHRSDRELLTEFARNRDEYAFTELVRRHTALVAGVCRRVLRNEQDVEDVFQATFLILSRKARAVSWHESAANWLHSVAYHLAPRARKNAARLQKLQHDFRLVQSTAHADVASQKSRELQEVLDQELARLPETCRSALILCYLEGRTRDQAAQQSGLSVRTLDRRLEEGRKLLRVRLARRGLDLSVVVLATALGDSANAGYAQLASATVQFVIQHASIKGGLTFSVLKLANSSLPGMAGNSMKVVAGLVLTIAMATAGVAFLGQNAISARDPGGESNAKKSLSQKPEKAPVPQPQLDISGDPLPEGATARLGGTRFHITSPRMLAYSPDGKLLFAGNQDGIDLIEPTTGRLIRHLGGDLKTTCWATLVSPDGKLAAIGELQGSPSGVIYETATGKLVCKFQAPDNHFSRLGAFSPDGALLAAIAMPGLIDFYDAKTGKFLRSLDWEAQDDRMSFGGDIAFMDVAFMPDGKTLLASTHGTGVIRTFDFQTGKELSQIKASANGIAAMVLSKNGTRLAVVESASRPSERDYYPDFPGKRVMIFDPHNGQRVAEIFAPTNVSRMALSSDGKNLFAGKDELGIAIWDLNNGKRIGTVPYPHKLEWPGLIALAPDGKTIAGGDTICVHVCDAATGKEIGTPPGHGGAISSVALHPFDSIVATGGRDGRLLLWDRTTGRMLREIVASSGQVNGVNFSPDGRHLYAITELVYPAGHTSVRCWNSSTGKEVWRLDDHPVRPAKMVLSPDGKTLAAVGATEYAKPGKVKPIQPRKTFEDDGPADGLLIEAATGKPIRTLDGDGEKSFAYMGWGSLTSLAFTPDGSELLAWGDNKGIHRWKIATGEHSVQASEKVNTIASAVAFSPDRKALVMGGSGIGHLIMVDVASGTKIRDIHSSDGVGFASVFGAAFSPDGRTLAWGGPADGVIRLVDAGTGTVRGQLKNLHGSGTSIVYSTDGKTVVADCGDGTALVWDLAKVSIAKGR